MKHIDTFVTSLESQGFELTRESSFSEFLGIKLEQSKDKKKITLTQRGLIQKIINTVGLQDCNPNWTPTIQTALGSDPEGLPMNKTWGYPSVVGMLLYLSTNTRPDITFAISQVARFNNNPKASHARAIKTIVRYLKCTCNMGTIVEPTGKLNIECWVDADFAGLHGSEPSSDRNSARSRTGWIVCLGGTPLLWKSQLQSCVTLSTLEAEYVALSAALRTVVWTKAMVLEVSNAIGLSSNTTATIHATVFEDNQGAYLLVTKHRISARTKYFAVKYHWFHSLHDDGEFDIEKCSTDEQRADYLTKGLVRHSFEWNRTSTQGW
jgi:hypothetical protein